MHPTKERRNELNTHINEAFLWKHRRKSHPVPLDGGLTIKSRVMRSAARIEIRDFNVSMKAISSRSRRRRVSAYSIGPSKTTGHIFLCGEDNLATVCLQKSSSVTFEHCCWNLTSWRICDYSIFAVTTPISLMENFFNSMFLLRPAGYDTKHKIAFDAIPHDKLEVRQWYDLPPFSSIVSYSTTFRSNYAMFAFLAQIPRLTHCFYLNTS